MTVKHVGGQPDLMTYAITVWDHTRLHEDLHGLSMLGNHVAVLTPMEFQN